ncbi:hypothetical protein [Paenibacillus sp. NAIST15-1]|uniref:hypothetical protein n=1 Tax=Paenibacillus sp. NAIST15-1 TaxID=1605994 RepID=UPI00086E0AC9|nr:hypothetical protein [Paenibacillus sp. NAIST15-1]GAV11455.1 hypothetical protein PBN151_1384 [Paenibacillus sp. NAIST15-1]
MKHTREKLESFDNAKIDFIAGKLSGKEIGSIIDNKCFVYMEEWEDPTLFQPTQKVYMTEVISQRALELNPIEYVRQLDGLMWPSGYAKAHEYALRNVIKMLQATPRQRTIASILTLQGQGGTGE